MCGPGTHHSHHVSGCSDTDTGILRIEQGPERRSMYFSLLTHVGIQRDCRSKHSSHSFRASTEKGARRSTSQHEYAAGDDTYATPDGPTERASASVRPSEFRRASSKGERARGSSRSDTSMTSSRNAPCVTPNQYPYPRTDIGIASTPTATKATRFMCRVSVYSGDMGDTLGPNGLSIGSSRHASSSKYPRS